MSAFENVTENVFCWVSIVSTNRVCVREQAKSTGVGVVERPT